MKIKLLVLIFFNLLVSQAEYQVLTTPKNIVELSTNRSIPYLENDSKYTFSLIQYPADIKMYNFRIENYSVSILDYGIFEDRFYDTLYKTFTAQEILAEYFYNYKIQNLKFGITTGLYYSRIYDYTALGINNSFNLNFLFNKINSSLGLSVENIGYMLKQYTAYNTKTPLKYRFLFKKNFNFFIIEYNLLYSKNNHDYQHILYLELLLSDKVKLRLSNTNYLRDLFVEDNDYNFLSGLGMGVSLDLQPISIDIGYMNLGISGVAYGVSLHFIGN
tara:strand:- start:11112 stop:11933 length:822 start_codon:yes stop_codon:yes gene_type:complete